MRKIIPLLLLAGSCVAPVLEAANSVAIQQLTRVSTVPPAVTARIVQTQGQVLKLASSGEFVGDWRVQSVC